MRVALIAPASSVHTRKWTEALVARRHDVIVVSAHTPTGRLGGAEVVRLKGWWPTSYLTSAAAVRKALAAFGPDLVLTESASGYGTLGRLSGWQPHVVAVWGSDVFEFPERSPLHKWWLRRNLESAFQLLATSECLRRRTEELVSPRRPVAVVPFGVDTRVFVPPASRSGRRVIGTVKGLKPVYGVDTLIRAFSLIVQRASYDVELRIGGEGPEDGALRSLARRLGVEGQTRFLGRVPPARVPEVLNEFDIFVALSRRESFGVSLLEASACELPIVASRVGGIPEVVVDGDTGILVPPDDAEAAADACLSLLSDENERRRLGRAGRARVIELFEWESCVDRLEVILETSLRDWRAARRGGGGGNPRKATIPKGTN